MKKLIFLVISVLFLASVAHASNSPPPGGNTNIINNTNGQYGAYALGNGLVTTTSGGTTFLNSTATGGVAPAGGPGAIQYNNSGSFAGYGVGTGLNTNSGNLNVTGVPTGAAGTAQLNGGSGNFVTTPQSAATLLGSVTTNNTQQIFLGTNLSLVTVGGQTFLNATGTGGGGVPANAIIEETGTPILTETGNYLVEE